MKIAVVGYGVEGAASYAYFTHQGHEVTICDQATDLAVPSGAQTQLGEHYLDNLDRFDFIIRTAGMHPSVILDKNPGVAGKITTQLNHFMQVCPTKNVIGVTGTKGKGTTSTLITKMLEAGRKQVFLGGNIGVSLFSFLDKLTPDSWVVLELSSFQLIDFSFSPHIAVCLMVVPEHLNWHTDMAEYISAKSQLFKFQTAEDIAIYFAESDTSKQIASAGSSQKVPYFASPGAFVQASNIVIENQVVCATSELKLLGEHNWQNACAAVTAAWYAGLHDIAALKSVLSSFSGLEHRLELVRELNGVRYYNDSFGTTPETAIVAIQAFQNPKVVILGGSDKGASYDQLAHVVAGSNIRKVLLIGEQADRIRTALEAAGFSNFDPGGGTMEMIVAKAREVAQDGDVVLLSTGCASFDMFENYKDRGNKFKVAVNSLS